MRSGKLDEELARMSAIADELMPCSAVLFNESFGATNDREGSEIARQVIEALLESSIKVLFVTHQYTLANTFCKKDGCAALFLRAQRDADGRRTFKLEEGKALPTGYGEDLYWRIGGWTGAPSVPAVDSSFVSMGDGAGTPRSQDGRENT